jgi:YidC/Oxa1 family membrane protein insertase
MQNDNTRNTILFVVSAIIVLVVYQFLVIEPAARRQQAEAARLAAAEAPVDPAAGAVGRDPALPGAPAQMADRETVVASTARAQVATPSLTGSIALRGARIDDLFLNNYKVSVDRGAESEELLRPEGAEFAWFAEFGWTGANLPGLPTPDTRWDLVDGETLTPTTPITLRYANGQGLTFTRQISVDERYMFTITDTVANTGAGPVTLAPYGSVQRQGIPSDLGKNQIVHEGAVGWLGEELRLVKYNKWAKEGGPEVTSTGGWLGITDKYWLAALIPEQDEQLKGEFRVTRAGPVEIFEANYVGQPRTIPAGRQISETTRFFAGAKTVPVLRAYERDLNIPRLDSAVDWGNFWFLTRPLFDFLNFIYKHVGNVGLAILALTVVVKLVFFPLANKSYESLTKMKKVQPQIEELRAKYKDDPAKQQQELLGLYKSEKINPLTGCLPMLLQIPVFYALYKVLTVTIEMRHAPFYGWIEDLSARDPTTIFNLFGAIPWDPAMTPMIGGFLNGPLHLGVLPLLYGFTMWLTTAMNPPATDPIQQRIFQLMPILFTFIMAPFAAGLLIYWIWNNVLTIGQQYLIMRKFQVDNPIDSLIARFKTKKVAE